MAKKDTAGLLLQGQNQTNEVVAWNTQFSDRGTRYIVTGLGDRHGYWTCRDYTGGRFQDPRKMKSKQFATQFILDHEITGAARLAENIRMQMRKLFTEFGPSLSLSEMQAAATT